MKYSLLASLLLSGFLMTGGAPGAQAQSRQPAPAAHGYIPWFTVQNKALVVQTGENTKLLDRDVTLPNGTRIEYKTMTVVLVNGTRVRMQEGDMLSLAGEFAQKPLSNQVTPADATASTVPVAMAAPAPVVAPVAAAAPVGARRATAPLTFTYAPAAPVNGKLRGVVELGASGFNMFIIRMDEKRNWKLEKSEFGNSLVMENMASEDDVRNGLKAYIGKMLDFGVSGRDIHFVVSSGALMADNTRHIIKSLEGLKYVVKTVTPEEEGVLAFKAAMPTAFASKAFVVDMGSANSKIAWLASGQARVQESYGSKYYEKSLDDATAASDIKAKAQQVPIGLRGTCFIIGGVPYELAKAVRQGQEAFTVLHAPTDYPQLSGAKIKSGLNLYQALTEATGCKQFVFGYDSNFTIGYLLSL